MAGIVNIRRDVDDKFYRYRMPLLLTKIEGKGNGIKTVIPNMSDVARALSRPPTYPTKFFGSELGAQTTVDEKNDRYIVNGAHDASRLRELLDGFIDKFVLCGACKNPETDLTLTKNEMIIRDCKACGERTNVDMRHKLATYIIKNPPKKNKKGKKGGHAEAPTPPGGEANGDGEDADGAGSDDELSRRIKAEAAELNQDAALAKEDWSADTSPEAVKRRQDALNAGLGNMAIGGDDDSDEDADSPYSRLGRWVQENPDANAVDVFKKVQELGIEKKHKAVQVLAQTLFTENVVGEIPKYTAIFAKMVTSEKHQKALLGGIERLVGLEHPDLVPTVPKILMVFYQADILEEEVVTTWGTHVSKKYVDKDTSKKVRKASEPFLKWLQEAEDDEDEE
ncbi:eukaryotic translation initiation factor 5 [Amylostereum chailletii]|nr:eukaryotic translation initiation factor 5 [Amylostereum chailletii]